MKIEEYQALAMRTSTDGHDRAMNGCMGLIGEAGELVDVVKKWKFQSGDDAVLPVDRMVDECGDILWYCAELATGLRTDLAQLFKEKNFFFDDLQEINEESPLETTVMRLAAAASRPAMCLFDAISYDGAVTHNTFLEASAKAEIVGIMTTVRDILKTHCHTSLTDAMEHNIEKLRRRYPDGFDPQRSMHRSEETG